ncbi:hypothetical protein CCACVL1_08496 [Corchorus capsularis]|uniref:Uncharacterized protein n=1 Tax=Corchorus capsularis TaxID=210143 RepID=A0A1R3J0D0_COCAP|nr:hypothetical protein CCACVL1_08496 [Corchorus capsularis]
MAASGIPDDAILNLFGEMQKT